MTPTNDIRLARFAPLLDAIALTGELDDLEPMPISGEHEGSPSDGVSMMEIIANLMGEIQ